MAIPKFEVDMDIIAKIPEYPADGGFTPETFKKQFDLAGKYLQEYINTILLPELDKTVDVDALIADILDESLSDPEKAAPAKIVGDLLRKSASQAMMAKTFERAVRSGDYLLEYDQNLRVQMVTATKARVYGGAYITQGNYVELNPGSYVELSLLAGTTGLYRNDLICGRYQRDADGNVSCGLVVVTGTASQSGATDPLANTGNINADGAVIHDTPIARVQYNGTSVSVETVIEGDENKRVSIVLPASGWSDTAPFTQNATVQGMNDSKFVKAYPDIPDDAVEEAALAEETVKVTSCKRSGDTMTFRCREDKPVLDIPVIVEVHT